MRLRCPLLLAVLLLAACETALDIPEAATSGPRPYIHVAEAFETDAFRERFRMTGRNEHVSIVPSPDSARAGNVLRVEVVKGGHYGADFSWRFLDHLAEEPERLYARYFIYFEPGWDSGTGGKLPGPAGRYHRAGWGGRRANGRNGWSARMSFYPAFRDGATQLGYYAYDLDQRTPYGRGMPWDRSTNLLGFDSVGAIDHGRWYCVESFIHLNELGERNGRLTGWVDGELAIDSKGLRFRTVPELRIEEYWINVYFGGTAVARQSSVLYLDDLLLADTRLGCDAMVED